MMQTDRRVTSAASTMGDLVARASIMTDDDVNEVFDAAKMVLAPSPIQNAKFRITSIENDEANKVVWSDGFGGLTPLPEGSEVEVPENLIPEGGTVILAEVEYSYSSEIGYFIDNERTLKDQFYLRPRRVQSVVRED